MSNKEEILFERNIVNSVAEELGMHPKKISLHMTFFKHFINEIAQSDKHSLQFPHLGVMYRNLKGCAYTNMYIERTGLLRREEDGSKYKKIMEKNNKDIETIFRIAPNNYNSSPHIKRRRIHSPYFTKFKNKKFLEEFQNESRHEKQDTED
jgi:hypothetical protein